MVSILICSTNSNNYKKLAYDNGFYAKSHFVDNVCCSITNNETSRNCSISAPVRLTPRAKLLSQMNPIAGSMSVDSRSVEIQASAASPRPRTRDFRSGNGVYRKQSNAKMPARQAHPLTQRADL